MLLRGLTAQDRDSQPNGQLDVIDGSSAWDDVGLFPLDQVLDLSQGLGTVDQHLSQ